MTQGSNTSTGRKQKGSAFWIQTLVNLCGDVLAGQIRAMDPSLGPIGWLSPLKEQDYREQKIHELPGIQTDNLNFWPDNGPWWDAVGIDDKGILLLVEAKGHLDETRSKCRAKDPKSLALIRQSMKTAHRALAAHEHPYSESLWLEVYHQLGNRLTFIHMLRCQGISVRLVLLNLVNDPTHISTSEPDWRRHYASVFQQMLGGTEAPNNVLLVYPDVG